MRRRFSLLTRVTDALKVSRAERFVRAVGQAFAGRIYRVTAHGADRLPTGGFLLLPNHLTWVDAVVLQLACPRPIRFVVDAEIHRIRYLNPFFRAIGALPISTRQAKEAIRTAGEAIRR